MQTIDLDGRSGNTMSLISIGESAKRQMCESRQEQRAFRDKMLKLDTYKAVVKAFVVEFRFLYELTKDGETVTEDNIDELF
ncbi:hypothetical protein [Moritella sp. F3]|uniref:hypothetical protein n=1 Tax=Moritella sp. F3 TaxID=2718882 RepID=UPI0018E146C4|nr:hypothetical protein [Moritella sp. F3]GIC77729.1 hypothetical protein FMO001_24560 [Moritella sp. F1]GIC82142.1 hypothetical protein FMO003_24230 [Moritella sp. F3]